MKRQKVIKFWLNICIFLAILLILKYFEENYPLKGLLNQSFVIIGNILIALLIALEPINFENE